MRDPALSMTLDDLRFVALIDKRLADAPEVQLAPGFRPERKPCPGCVDPCFQCDDDALD